jgi:hypothetical protein
MYYLFGQVFDGVGFCFPKSHRRIEIEIFWLKIEPRNLETAASSRLLCLWHGKSVT